MLIILLVLYVIVIIVFLYYSSLTYGDKKNQPDYNLSIKSLCEKYGYEFESFEIETKDNYILAIHRIRNPASKKKTKNLPVLLVHGLSSSSIHWLTNGTEKSLGFHLANEGYDLWLANLRGNIYSRKHRFLSSYNWFNNYWDFSFHESGYFDLPATVDYVLQKTGKQQLHYIGLSEGTTSFFVMASSRPEYNDKIKGFVALAPSVYMANPKGLWVRIIKKSETFIKFLYTKLYIREFPIPVLLQNLMKVVSKDDSLLQKVAFKVFQFFTHEDESLFNKSQLPIVVANLSGLPLKTLLHYTQISKTEVFKAFDYGIETNQLRYGQNTPPEYNLSLVTTPTFLMYAPNDFLTNNDDVKRLIKELPNVVREKCIPNDTFGHASFCFSNNIHNLVYNDLMQFLTEAK